MHLVSLPCRSVTWDRNNTSATGFLDVARALEHNFILQYMPLPFSDISQAYRSAPERTEQALTKIQRALVRNNQTQRFSQRQALRLHQGLVTSTAEQVMERLCVRVQQQVCVLRGVGEMEEIQAAKQVLKEARNSRALYPSLCELAHVLSVDGPVRQRLDSLAGELAKAADKELQVIVDSMVSLCHELCPISSTAAERLSPSLSSVSERVSIPRSSIRTALMERAAQDIHRALEEVKLSVVSYLTNTIVDQFCRSSTPRTSHCRQVSHLKRWDGVGEEGTSWRYNRHRDSLDITDEEISTSIDTIAIKKRSSRTRRIRPVSSRLSLCDDSSSSPPPSVPSYSSPLSRSASWEGLSELPTHGLPLHHVTRVRPRPPRKHKGAHMPTEMHCSENGGISPLDDGIPDFYTKRVLPDSQLSSLHKAHSLRRKKRRNMLAIFSFRKNRSQNQSNQGPTESEAEFFGDGCHTVATAPTGTATENVYTLLQPPRSGRRAGSPGEGADGKKADNQKKSPPVLSPQPMTGFPHSAGGSSKHPFYSPREVTSLRMLSFQDIIPLDDMDRYWVDDKQRTAAVLRHTEKPQWYEDRTQDSPGDPKTTERHWSEGRHPDRAVDRQWTVDRHTQRQIDRKMERQLGPGGRYLDRSWSEYKPAEVPAEHQWTDTRQSIRKPVQTLNLAQRPLPPYPSDRTPSPKQDSDLQKGQAEVAADWLHGPPDAQGDRLMCPSVGGGQVEVWRGTTGGGPKVSKPDPPPQSSKPNLSKLRQRSRLESAEAVPGTRDEGLRPQAPIKPQRSRKAMSCDTGPDRESPNNVEKPPNRKPPVKKPRLPQNRNKSLELSGTSLSVLFMV
uniref:CARMIL C-terminal domain-containing protein n=1 Tax=Neogobius melanostomus TaxID=47308 RepID=A0A8C6S8M8_9GOBI